MERKGKFRKELCDSDRLRVEQLKTKYSIARRVGFYVRRQSRTSHQSSIELPKSSRQHRPRQNAGDFSKGKLGPTFTTTKFDDSNSSDSEHSKKFLIIATKSQIFSIPNLFFYFLTMYTIFPIYSWSSFSKCSAPIQTKL